MPSEGEDVTLDKAGGDEVHLCALQIPYIKRVAEKLKSTVCLPGIRRLFSNQNPYLTSCFSAGALEE